MASIFYQLMEGKSASRLVAQYGETAVAAEVEDMIYVDMADRALDAAVQMQNQRLIREASRVILCGNYGREATQKAADYNTDPDLRSAREAALRR